MSKYVKGTRSTWKDLTGIKFNRLTVLGYLGNSMWECKCDCGNLTIIRAKSITTGQTKSCGCLQKEIRSKLSYKHGKKDIPEYNSWRGMKARCNYKKHKDYKNYGGKGIKVCDEWLNSFEQFFSDMGKRPPGCTLDRKNVLEGYNKDNCRWADINTQANNKSSSIYLTFNGITKTLSQFASEYKLNKKTLKGRLERGWSIEKALTTPTLIIFRHKTPVTK